MLRAIEQKIESLFEGVFSRAFRTHVQPVELARKLAKEMDDHRTVSVSRVYVPNEYSIYLAPGDREQFSSYEDSLATELQDYLAEHARRERYALLSPPKVLLHTDADLSVGEFGIATRMAEPARGPKPAAAGGPAPQATPGQTMIYRPAAADATQAASPADLGLEPPAATLQFEGKRRELDKRRLTIGRSRECDIQLADPNTSRRHAEIRHEGTGYWIVDLASTNGLQVNGRKLERAKLADGDTITLGSTDMVFEQATS